MVVAAAAVDVAFTVAAVAVAVAFTTYAALTIGVGFTIAVACAVAGAVVAAVAVAFTTRPTRSSFFFYLNISGAPAWSPSAAPAPVLLGLHLLLYRASSGALGPVCRLRPGGPEPGRRPHAGRPSGSPAGPAVPGAGAAGAGRALRQSAGAVQALLGLLPAHHQGAAGQGRQDARHAQEVPEG